MADGRSTNGGARRGSGRKPAVRAADVAQVLDKALEELDQNYINLRNLADGAVEIVTEEWAAAGTVKQGLSKGSKLVFDDAASPRELVLVRRKVSRLAPSLAANEYLTNRVMGRPAFEGRVLPEETDVPAEQQYQDRLDISGLDEEEKRTLSELLRRCPRVREYLPGER